MTRKENLSSREMAVTAVEIYELVKSQREYEIGLINLVSGKPSVLLSDLEGPFIVGDTAMQTVKKYFPNGKGGDFYNACYEWYDPLFYKTGLSQEAGDIIMALPILLACGTTGGQILEVARESKPTRGSQKVIDSMKSRGGLVLGVTSAWSQHHRPVTEQIGLDGLFGTEFPIDEIREKFGQNERFLEEMQKIRDFANKFDPAVPTEERNQQIEDFYMGKLGIRFTQSESRGEERSIIGAIVNQLRVVGDRGKLEVFRRIQEKRPPVLITMGDGLNDKLMLSESLSIAINGPKAVRGAKIGVITNDMGITADIIDLIASGRLSDPNEIVEKFNGDSRGIVHLGGENTPDYYTKRHQEMRIEMRGEAANF